MDHVGACVLSDYAKGVVSPRLAQKLIDRARQAGKPVIVDPKGTDHTVYRGATVLKPNLHEVERFLNSEILDEDRLLQAGRKLATSLEGTAIVITRGSQGMILFRGRTEPLHISAVARQVFDVTGAGDTVVAMLAAALAVGLSLEQGIRLGNVAAGIVVGKVGTASVAPDELIKALE